MSVEIDEILDLVSLMKDVINNLFDGVEDRVEGGVDSLGPFSIAV